MWYWTTVIFWEVRVFLCKSVFPERLRNFLRVYLFYSSRGGNIPSFTLIRTSRSLRLMYPPYFWASILCGFGTFSPFLPNRTFLLSKTLKGICHRKAFRPNSCFSRLFWTISNQPIAHHCSCLKIFLVFYENLHKLPVELVLPLLVHHLIQNLFLKYYFKS